MDELVLGAISLLFCHSELRALALRRLFGLTA